MTTTDIETEHADTSGADELADMITDDAGQIDWQATADYWKATSRQLEDDAKRSAAESAQLRATFEQHAAGALSAAELEKVRADATAEVAAEFRDRLTDAEFRAAAVGRSIDLEHLLRVIDRTKLCGADGTPDRALIVATLDRLAPVAPAVPIVPTVERIPLTDIDRMTFG